MAEMADPGSIAVGLGEEQERWYPAHQPEVGHAEHGADHLVLSAAAIRALAGESPTDAPASFAFAVDGQECSLQVTPGTAPGTLRLDAVVQRRGTVVRLGADVRESWVRSAAAGNGGAEGARRVVLALEEVEALPGQTTVRRAVSRKRREAQAGQS